MAKTLGRAFLFKAKNAGVYTTVGGIKATKFSLNNSTIDVTTQDSIANNVLYSEIEAGIQKFTVDGSILFDSDGTAKLVMDAARLQTPIDAELVMPNYGTFQNAAFLVTKLEVNAPVEKEISAAITLEASGQVNFS